MTLSQATTDAAPPGTRIRTTAWAYTPMAVVGALVAAEGIILGQPFSLTVMGLVFVAESLILRWFGITLTPTEAIVHSLRWRRIPWSQVQAVTQEPFCGIRRVVLWTPNGRQPLRAPVTQWFGLGKERFERDYHAIGQFWLAHRGPDWQQQA